jgi:beta-lactamase class A
MTEIMERNTTGKARIRGRLPDGLTVAEKTGTIGSSLNDVGMVTLPENAGKILVAIFITRSKKPFEDRERAISDISRALYDYYLFEDAR